MLSDIFLIYIYKMAIKCIIIILLLFKYYKMENINNFSNKIRINSLFFKIMANIYYLPFAISV